jgi:hypothetical protein
MNIGESVLERVERPGERIPERVDLDFIYGNRSRQGFSGFSSRPSKEATFQRRAKSQLPTLTKESSKIPSMEREPSTVRSVQYVLVVVAALVTMLSASQNLQDFTMLGDDGRQTVVRPTANTSRSLRETGGFSVETVSTLEEQVDDSEEITDSFGANILRSAEIRRDTSAAKVTSDSIGGDEFVDVVEISRQHIEPPSDIKAAVCFKTLFGDIDLGIVLQWVGT